MALLLLTVSGPPALAKDMGGDPVAGRALAHHICAECHLVGGPDPDSLQRGPNFTDLAADPKMTDSHLRKFLDKPHGKMPEISLNDTEIGDLISYIRGLED